MAKNGLKPLSKLGNPRVKNSNPKPVRVIREDKAPYKRKTYPETWRAMDRHFGLRPKPRGGDRAKLHKRADSAWYAPFKTLSLTQEQFFSKMDEIAQAERPYDKALLAQVEQDLVVFFSTLRRLRVSLSRNFSEFKHYNHHLDPRLQPNRQFMRQCIAERRQNGDWDNYRILNTVYAVEFPDEFHHAFERDKDGHVLSVPGAWVRMKKAAKDQLGWQVEDIDREYEEAILNPVTQPDSLEDLKVGPKMPWLIKVNGKAYTNKQIFSAMSPKREKKDRRRDKQLTFGGDLHPTASHIKTGRQPKLTPANTPNGETLTIPDDLNDSLQDLLTM